MAIIGVETLTYGVEDLERSTDFFVDFGLTCLDRSTDRSVFELPEGSRVVLLPEGHGDLPTNGSIQGHGVREVIWGVDNTAEFDRLVAALQIDTEVARDADGTARFLSGFGVPMGLRVFAKRTVTTAPDPLNAPGHVGRLNQHRKWRQRARPKVIAHVVFSVPDYEKAADYMIERLGFRLSDSQRGFGKYLRAPGTINHHNLLLLNANAPIPGMDGVLRFHHANFGVEDIDEIMVGANYMYRKSWTPSILGLGRHRLDSALFYYLPCPAGGEAEYGADSDCVDDSWVPREWPEPLFGYAQFVHNLPDFLRDEPEWRFEYVLDEKPTARVPG